MKLSSWRKVDKGDYPPENSVLIDKLSTPLNAAMDELYDALDNKLDFTDNINATITSFTVAVDELGTPKSKVTFKLKESQTSFTGMTVLDVVGVNENALEPQYGVFVRGVKNANTIVVKKVKGLQPDSTYRITVLSI